MPGTSLVSHRERTRVESERYELFIAVIAVFPVSPSRPNLGHCVSETPVWPAPRS